MTEEQKELLKEKLKQLLDEKLNALTDKFQTDIDTIETLKYSYFDNVVLPFREIEEKNEKAEKEQREKKKEQKEKLEETRKERRQLYEKLSRTPVKHKTSRDFGLREKTEMPITRSKVFAGKKATKNDNSIILKERMKKKNVTTIDVTRKVARSKTPVRHRGRKTDDDITKTKNIKATPVKTANISKKIPVKGKVGDKKVKKEKKKDEEEKKDDITKTTEEEVKKEVVMEDKSIINVPEELKDNNTLLSIYFMLKGKYLNNKEKYEILLCNPTIYKSFGSNLQFLLDDKKKDLQEKIEEIESFLNNYGDLETYLTKEFVPSKTAQNSLMFIKKDEILNIIKKGDIPDIINKLFKLLLIIFDIEFDETLENENLLNYFITEVIDKNNVKDLKQFATSYFSTNNDLRMSKEKVEKVNAIVDSEEKILSTTDVAKINRNISYTIMLFRDCYDYLNSKTLDDVPYYELREKNKLLKEYKDKLSILEKGPQTNSEEVAKEETDENNKENQKVEEINVAKESDE